MYMRNVYVYFNHVLSVSKTLRDDLTLRNVILIILMRMVLLP